MERNKKSDSKTGEVCYINDEEVVGEARKSRCNYYRETNPLLIDAVLHQLVHYLGIDDLKTLRLVHHRWNRAIIPRLRKCCRVVFRPVGMEEWEELKLLASSQDNAEMSKAVFQGSKAYTDLNEAIISFLETFSKGLDVFGEVPFHEFKLIDFPFESEVGCQFFQLCGQYIKALDIRVNRKKGTSKLPASFGGDFYPNLLTIRTPYLKKLVLFPFPGMEKSKFSEVITHLEGIHFKEWASKELLYPETFLEDLLERTIRLHEIWISIGLENCKSVENILIAVATSRRFSYLTKLHIAYLRLNHLEILHELALQRHGRLRLRSFRIEALAHDVPTSLFESFLRTQSVNLEELYCRRFLGSSKFGKFTFPRMLGLRKLDCELSGRQVMPLRCNTRFPNLQTLNLFGTCCQVFTFDRQFCGNRVSDSLTALHFRPGLIVTGSIITMAEHFPCLKSLTLSVVNSGDLKQLLRSCWTETLEDLELYFSDGILNIDSILIGMSVDKCRLLNRFVLQVLSKSELLHRIAEEVERKENIVEEMQDWPFFFGNVSLRNFKNLKTLHLEFNAFLMSRNTVKRVSVTSADNEQTSNDLENNNEDGVHANDVDGEDNEDNVEPLSDESYLPSDLTGYFALAQMKSLRRISIPECLFTKECCTTLTENLDLVGWKFCSEASDIIPPRKT